jgi:hypothetical protein
MSSAVLLRHWTSLVVFLRKLEIFSEKDFYESMDVVNTLWEQLHL